MRTFSMAGLAGIFFVMMAVCSTAAPVLPGWQSMRDHQPAGLHLKMTLPKKEYFQGEKIDATVEFSNDNPKAVYVVDVEADGHIPPARFYAMDEQGKMADDPLAWCNAWYPMTEMERGSGNMLLPREFGDVTLPASVNHSIRFDRPGTYKIYAMAQVYAKNTAVRIGTGVEINSDPITIAIVPRTAAEEQAVMDTAAAAVTAGEREKFSAATAEAWRGLACLQTPAARDALLALLGGEMDGYIYSKVGEGLYSAPDPGAVADRMLELVKSGKLSLDGGGLGAELYGNLKLYRIMPGFHGQELNPKEQEARSAALKQAKQEILDAQIAASGGNGPDFIKAQWAFFSDVGKTFYEDEDHDAGKARAALAAHQLELPDENVRQLLRDWSNWGSADFLPLVRREANPPASNFDALLALAELAPDEARPLVIEEMSQTAPRFFEINSWAVLCATQPLPLPQFDRFFRTELGAVKEAAFPVISCFASPALLQDVLKVYRSESQEQRNQWDDYERCCLFYYWIRCDAKAGLAAFEKELAANDNQAPYTMMEFSSWREEIRPVVEWALTSSNSGIVAEAATLLSRHGADSEIEPVIAALERLKSAKIARDDDERLDYVTTAAELLKSKRWHYSEEQKQRLAVLARDAKSN